MPGGLYRLYDASESRPGLVEGITVYFIDDESHSDEPLLILGQIKYHIEQDTPVKNVSKEWDLWHAFFSCSDNQTLNEVLTPTSEDTNRIEWMKVIAVPLYTVQNMECVEKLMERVRAHKLTESVLRQNE
jgi:hypothetical protein